MPLLDENLNVIVEAASHEALEKNGAKILSSGIDLIPASIGALDAIQAVMCESVEDITMTSRKPPVAWKGIPYVDRMNLDLNNMKEPTVLFEGSAQDCVKRFPQNINIAAALSLAGVGFGKTRIRILADPTVQRNTHEIVSKSDAGKFTIKLENVPDPENPKTTYMASYSVVAALRNLRTAYRVGT